MQKAIFLLCCLCFSSCFAEGDWRSLWHNGVDHLQKEQYEEASLELDQAINLMSEEELDLHPYVLVSRVWSRFALNDFAGVMTDSESALKSKNLTNEERLFCGMRRIAVLVKLDEEDAAVEEYKKHIIDCPLLPKWEYSEDKIIVRNVLDCECYKSYTRERMKANYCDSDDDIHEYGNMWIINVTKKQQSIIETEEGTSLSHMEIEHDLSRAKLRARTPREIRACCNTCNRFSVAANTICGCLTVGGFLASGPWTATACAIACTDFVEELRQNCELACHNDLDQPWKDFETWKEQYKKEYSKCPKPPVRCPN